MFCMMCVIDGSSGLIEIRMLDGTLEALGSGCESVRNYKSFANCKLFDSYK